MFSLNLVNISEPIRTKNFYSLFKTDKHYFLNPKPVSIGHNHIKSLFDRITNPNDPLEKQIDLLDYYTTHTVITYRLTLWHQCSVQALTWSLSIPIFRHREINQERHVSLSANGRVCSSSSRVIFSQLLNGPFDIAFGKASRVDSSFSSS